MKTIIVKTDNKNVYKVNGKIVEYNERKNAWKTHETLSIQELYDFQQFLKHGQLSRADLECKLNKLEVERMQLVEKLKLIALQHKPRTVRVLYEKKLSKVIQKIADYRFNVVVYQN